jgi:rod shape-determining protein MreC
LYRKQVRRRRAVLGLLVAASLFLLTLSFGKGAGSGLGAFERGVATALAPIETGANRALKPLRDLIGWSGDVVDAKGENKSLKRQVEELRSRLASVETAAGENRQLRALVGLREAGELPTGYRTVTSRVIVRSPTVWYATVTIDKGSSSGIRVDQPVINGDGLVGKVSAVTPNTAQVALITDHTSAISAEVVPTGAAGVAKPAVGDPADLLLDFIEPGRRVRRGQTVVTAGWRTGRLESHFPKGIPIGRVTRASAEERQTYQRVHIKPFVNLRRVEFAQVLVPRAGARGQGAAGALAQRVGP